MLSFCCERGYVLKSLLNFPICLLLGFSGLLHGASFEAKNESLFYCSHGCGSWGSQQILSIEWGFVTALYMVDLLVKDEEYLSSRYEFLKWQQKFPAPTNIHSSWYRNMDYFSKSPKEITYDNRPLYIENSDYLGYHNERTNDSWAYWGIKSFRTSEDVHFGKIFERQQFVWKYVEAKEVSYKKSSYKFDNYIDFNQSCEDLEDDVEWYYQGGYQFESHDRASHERPIMVKYYNRFQNHMKALKDQYISIFSNCANTHGSPFAEYQLTLHHIRIGEFSLALDHAKVLFQSINVDELQTNIASELCLTKGQIQLEIGYYDEAIVDFGRAIEKDPNCSDAYFLRAIAQFERGHFTEAINDYSKSNIRVTSLDETSDTPIKKYTSQEVLQFSTGIIEGATSGSLQSLQEFIPSTLNSLRGLANGLWAFALQPKQVSIELLQAANNIINFINSHDFLDAVSIIIPEIQELRQRGLSPYQKGQLIGKIIGRYGMDILMCSGSIKGIKAVMELKRANASLSLKVISKQIGKTEAFTEISQKWWKNTAPIIGDIKLQEGKLGSNLYNTFKSNNLNEHQVRKILHHAGFKTFARPSGIPQTYKVTISKKHGGMVYKHPTNPHIKIRVSPGNPNSINPAQRTPYVVHKTPKGPLDKKGRICKKDDIEIHIPVEEYDFIKLTKILPVDE